MNNDFNTTLAAMSAEEKVALLTGSGLWRTASLPQHGIEDIIMTDGTYGVRYSSAQIDGREKWSMDDFISVITQTADRASAEEPAAKGGVRRYSALRYRRPAFLMVPAACSWDVELVHQMGKRWGGSVSKWASGFCSGRGLTFAVRRWPGEAMNITPKTRWSAAILPLR